MIKSSCGLPLCTCMLEENSASYYGSSSVIVLPASLEKFKDLESKYEEDSATVAGGGKDKAALSWEFEGNAVSRETTTSSVFAVVASSKTDGERPGSPSTHKNPALKKSTKSYEVDHATILQAARENVKSVILVTPLSSLNFKHFERVFAESQDRATHLHTCALIDRCKATLASRGRDFSKTFRSSLSQNVDNIAKMAGA
ncbi:hypothetical protein M427DRAFT_147737 [Gonapodya prolifera JEL478]|uniref:Uncharacterized protein n=1 Tax=Gonapodya prolifera (strain JEL478) TaxID=1344416 RepID=A0A139A4C2_GONPJ|nr:hypothetical protein M427DRAFT_147737 [Gonapodya prolifera JEL478]|eukprot:KXS11564.1 hypothetical protein M427DRAFT_147737 [Gonapodya prolifera JEL478]